MCAQKKMEFSAEFNITESPTFVCMTCILVRVDTLNSISIYSHQLVSSIRNTHSLTRASQWGGEKESRDGQELKAKRNFVCSVPTFLSVFFKFSILSLSLRLCHVIILFAATGAFEHNRIRFIRKTRQTHGTWQIWCVCVCSVVLLLQLTLLYCYFRLSVFFFRFVTFKFKFLLFCFTHEFYASQMSIKRKPKDALESLLQHEYANTPTT